MSRSGTFQSSAKGNSLHFSPHSFLRLPSVFAPPFGHKKSTQVFYLCALILCIFCQVSVRVCQVFENHRKISTKTHFICQKFYPRKSATFAPINGKNLGKTEVFEGDIFFIATLWQAWTKKIFYRFFVQTRTIHFWMIFLVCFSI